MSFSFRVEGGSLSQLATEIREIEYRALEEELQIRIDKSHLLYAKPYIIVTCEDDEKGRELFNRVKREAPRFLRE